jgi:hypothetical protein
MMPQQSGPVTLYAPMSVLLKRPGLVMPKLLRPVTAESAALARP